MFIGRLGKERCFIVEPKGREPTAALGDACTEIADAIKRQHKRRTKELNQLITDALETICRVMSAPVTPEEASLRAFIFRKEREELICRYFWDPYESDEKVGLTRFRIDEEHSFESSRRAMLIG